MCSLALLPENGGPRVARQKGAGHWDDERFGQQIMYVQRNGSAAREDGFAEARRTRAASVAKDGATRAAAALSAARIRARDAD